MKIIRKEKGWSFALLVLLPVVCLVYGIIMQLESNGFDWVLAVIHVVIIVEFSLPLILFGFKVER